MNKKREELIRKIKKSWDIMDAKFLEDIQKLMREYSLEGLVKGLDCSMKGIELYRDNELGFVLTAYSENFDTYRMPHNHGNGWVIYSVVEGIVEMGTYFNWQKSPNQFQLILKEKNNLESGDVKTYYPGDIHDTRCLSENALIIRLTSCDLKVEEFEGRMKRFNRPER